MSERLDRLREERYSRPPIPQNPVRSPEPIPSPVAHVPRGKPENHNTHPETRNSEPETRNSQREAKRDPPRRPGGQPGNQNACTHGLYSGGMTRKERRLFEKAWEMGGNRAEKALLRVRLAEYMGKHPEDVVTLAKVVKALEIKS